MPQKELEMSGLEIIIQFIALLPKPLTFYVIDRKIKFIGHTGTHVGDRGGWPGSFSHLSAQCA